ncbi:conserved hypothetical protein [Leishmania braziliensis MHOM/BR/75/M2904]|uniref:Uncharacterized protein n=2 Tax=Leishmania braziliensis TaxID=5660 RepID=A4HMQ2_LEIBR|nr:conserved hypothetical protein [Leishmania braziliensis MHOM/BR/75/M2904]KAI5689296.1 hypothetical protein MNV84_07446 [Leishmania braziliensis]CAJ2480295.1 unnamed protein product [Leishmania braziliensis]CAM43440.1 conserved hypothetical protein [Leishmania braziliensis MHOM/BR/75/M2904]SYZ69512.1 hypothetical_protein [Leishmania braziliensis MHOM/BR/75/M2904]
MFGLGYKSRHADEATGKLEGSRNDDAAGSSSSRCRPQEQQKWERDSSTRAAKNTLGTPTMLGIQYTSEEASNIYHKVGTLNGYTFEVPPVNRFHSKTAEAKFTQLTGSLNPKFEATRFDNLRERLQVADKRDKDGHLQAIAVLYAEFLGNNFLKAKNLDYAELERCFYPHYAPKYDTLLKALGMRKPLWWRQGIFASLEDISRLPLDRCNVEKETSLTFEEWYSLFWNYYQPFNTLAYLCMVTAQSIVYTQELVDSVANYLVERHALITEEKAKSAPILFLGARTGKFGALLNATKKLPVPVIHTHESPNMNPYLLVIPQNKQAEFKPNPIVKMKNQAALEKYEPSIVLFSDMIMNNDPTSQIRQQGSVREYVYFGVPDSYCEGHGWDTWGYFKYRERGSDHVPAYIREGFGKVTLPHLSRWIVHKLDSDMQMGNAAVTSWIRKPLLPGPRTTWGWRVMRFKPFF